MRTLSLLCALGFLGCQPSHDPWQFYRVAAFAEAQDRSLSMVIHFNEDSKCDEQKKALLEAVQAPELKRLVAFRVEFGKEPLLQKSLGVNQACSLVAFKGAQFRGKIVKETKTEALKKFIKKSL